MKKQVTSPKAPKAIGPYSQAIRAGDFLYVSGQLPINAETGKMPEDVSAQARASLGNIGFILEEAGYSRDDIVKTTVFLADMGDFEAVNKEYAEFFQGCVFPARAAVQAARLPKDARVEIEAVAYRVQ
ncbi:MAG: RidA family protein [Spirochaetales bacterium]|jgi:2-iminobutanoate/2-iminopropanoate deaminase|nr:RidA family protein [Spirochaetales bacterium]